MKKSLLMVVALCGLVATSFADGVAVATWTGLGVANNLADYANWACEDANGDPVAEAVPDAGTTLRFTGALGVDFPAGMTLAFGDVEIDGTATLTRDCDWRGLGDILFKMGSKLDLAGHRLDLPTVQNKLRLQPIEYIESTGTQRIDTGIKPGSTTSLDIDFTTIGAGTYESTLFGTGNWNQHEYMLTLRNDGGRPMSFCWFGNYLFFDYYADRHLHLVCDSTNGALVLSDGDTNEQLSSTATTDFNCNSHANLYIFGQNNGSQGGKFGRYRIHAFKITQGGTLVRDFIPVREVGAATYGLYDKVDGGFYPADGLLHGADVAGSRYSVEGTRAARLLVPESGVPGYVAVDYIESTGAQVLNTGVNPGPTTSLDLDFETLDWVNENSLFAAAGFNQHQFLLTPRSDHGPQKFCWFGDYKSFDFFPNRHLRMVVDSTNGLIIQYDGETGEELTRLATTDFACSGGTLTLFGMNNCTKTGKYRIRALKITQGGELVRDYLPMVRTSDRKIGLYDRVSGAFHTADGLLVPVTYPEITDSTAMVNDIRPVAWIQSTGSQVLNTGVTPGSTTSLDIDFETFAWANENSLFAAASFNQHQFLLTPRQDFGSQQFCWFGNYKAFDYFPNRHLRMVVDSTNGVIIQYDAVTGEELTRLATTDFACSGGTLTLFGMNNGTKTGKYRIYAMKIYQGGNLVRDFVPCYSAVENRYGLYDLVNRQFHGANGLLGGPVMGNIEATGTQGMVAIDVAAGASYSLANVPLTGNLAVEKDGEGTLSIVEKNAFSGDVAVNEGKLSAGINGSFAPFGLVGNCVVIGADGTFDLNGNGYLTDYNFIVDGGQIVNSGAGVFNTTPCFGSITLTDDAEFDMTSAWGLIGVNRAATRLDLGGHTLTFTLENSTLCLFGTTVTNGKLIFNGTGQVWVSDSALNAGDVEIVHNCAGMPLAYDILARDFTDSSANSTGIGGGVIRVSRRYLATVDSYRACVLQNGATLDLSTRTAATPLPTASTATGLAGQTLAFADNATITLDLGERKVAGETRVVAWETAPANLETLTFNVTTSVPRAKYRVVVKDDGLYIDPSYTLIIIR